MGLFVTEAENMAILRQVKEKLEPSLFDSDEKLKFKLDIIAPKLRSWVDYNTPWRLQFAYRKWINFFENDCRRQLKRNQEYKEWDKASAELPPLPRNL